MNYANYFANHLTLICIIYSKHIPCFPFLSVEVAFHFPPCRVHTALIRSVRGLTGTCEVSHTKSTSYSSLYPRAVLSTSGSTYQVVYGNQPEHWYARHCTNRKGIEWNFAAHIDPEDMYVGKVATEPAAMIRLLLKQAPGYVA